MAECESSSSSSSCDDEFETIKAECAPEDEGIFDHLSKLSNKMGKANKGKKAKSYDDNKKHSYGGRDYNDPHGVMESLEFLAKPENMKKLKKMGMLDKLGPLAGVLKGMNKKSRGKGGRDYDFDCLGDIGQGSWDRPSRGMESMAAMVNTASTGQGHPRLEVVTGMKYHNLHGLGKLLHGGGGGCDDDYSSDDYSD
ncbi:cyclic nucleotide gated channel beta 1 [Branchiostoma belcheri]|nr:cyclic nucleotide gated channel beta 1 [Branchiostoma belcheri]